MHSAAKKIIATAALAGALGCHPKQSQQQAAPQNGPHDAITALRDFKSGMGPNETSYIHDAVYQKADGTAWNLDSLQTKLGGGYSTLSFMYSDCSGVCQNTASQLAALSKLQPGMKHLVLSLSPLADHSLVDDTGKTKLEQLAQQSGLTTGPGGNTIIVYPATRKPGNEAYVEGARVALGVEHGATIGLTTSGDDLQYHAAMVSLFSPQGKLLGQYEPSALANPQNPAAPGTLAGYIAAHPARGK